MSQQLKFSWVIDNKRWNTTDDKNKFLLIFITSFNTLELALWIIISLLFIFCVDMCSFFSKFEFNYSDLVMRQYFDINLYFTHVKKSILSINNLIRTSTTISITGHANTKKVVTLNLSAYQICNNMGFAECERKTKQNIIVQIHFSNSTLIIDRRKLIVRDFTNWRNEIKNLKNIVKKPEQ